MIHRLSLSLSPEQAFDQAAFTDYIVQNLNLSPADQPVVRKCRQSVDARGRQVRVHVEAEVYVGEMPPPVIQYKKPATNVGQAPRAIVVGAGPAGLFAALRLIELGLKPIVLERGSDVRARRRDLAAINKAHIVNPESNYCFGEGGAGTYSDGKLYTRSTKRGDVRRILEILVAHGATEQILVEAHPHIGTNKLPAVVTDLRQTILDAGGEIYFDTKVTDFIIANNVMRGVVAVDQKTETSREITGLGVILATGHSARDIFALLHQRDVLIEAKPFAMGVRIEHQQSLIDSLQYRQSGGPRQPETVAGQPTPGRAYPGRAYPGRAYPGRAYPGRGDYLPAASYSLVTQTRHQGVERGVFSFCMCPGGFIVPAATAPGELVVNGMSPSRRDSLFANSGLVVAITDTDLKPFAAYGPLAGLALQRAVEQRACQHIDGQPTQCAPAQRVADFVNGTVSASLLPTSYQPGLVSTDMREVLPDHIARPLQQGLREFGRKMPGYLSNNGQLIGIESRTSSPVRIPRDRATCQHVQVARLFPCGEGAGYAGGIVSAAMDGERCAEELVKLYSL